MNQYRWIINGIKQELKKKKSVNLIKFMLITELELNAKLAENLINQAKVELRG